VPKTQFSTKEPHETPREPLGLHRLWFTMNNVSRTKYILGHSPAEIQRLMSQAVMLRPITERLLRSAGIEPGMRVLDIGCGAGDVSMLAAELVGSTGSVVGIDRNEQVLAIARERARMAKFGQIDFKEASIGTFSDPEPFDFRGRSVCLDPPSRSRRPYPCRRRSIASRRDCGFP
jgi:protein-L-isoaspartate O-methyltransferase